MVRHRHPNALQGAPVGHKEFAECCGVRSGVSCHQYQVAASSRATAWWQVAMADGRAFCKYELAVVDLNAEEGRRRAREADVAVKADFTSHNPHLCRGCFNLLQRHSRSNTGATAQRSASMPACDEVRCCFTMTFMLAHLCVVRLLLQTSKMLPCRDLRLRALCLWHVCFTVCHCMTLGLSWPCAMLLVCNVWQQSWKIQGPRPTVGDA